MMAYKTSILRLSPLWAALVCLAMGCDEPVADDGMPPLLVERIVDTLVFEDPQKDCARCHPNHVDEWEISNHAYAAKDPVFHAMVRVGQAATEGKLGQFCVQCHSPSGMAAGQTPVAYDEDLGRFVQQLDQLDDVARQGVSCDVCHSITDVIEPVNARMVLTPHGVKRGTIADPVPTPAHASSYSPLHGTSDVCGSCHAVTNPKGALVEETFGEWAQSQAAAEGKTCQSCHMPEYLGQAATEGPQRVVHRHTFVGVDVSLLPEDEFPGYHEMRRMAATLLRASASMNVKPLDDNALEVTITNQAGHALPSGATAERQLWLELIVRDEAGQVVMTSGTLDLLGDLRDPIEGHSLEPGSDPQLAVFGQLLVNVPGLDGTEGAERQRMLDAATAACRPMGKGGLRPGSDIKPVIFPWEANWQCNSMIPPDGQVQHRYYLNQLPAGRYSASVRLLFRTFPPYFLRKLEEIGGLDEAVKGRVPTVTIATQNLDLTIF